MDGYFARLLDEVNVIQLSNAGMKLYQLEKDEARVSHMLNDQIKQLELMAEDLIPENTEELAGNQMRLENLVATVMFEYQSVKKEIFELIENVIKNNKVIA